MMVLVGRSSRLQAHAGRTGGVGDNVFRVSGNAVLVEINTVLFGFPGDAEDTHHIYDVHDDVGDAKSGNRSDGTADELSEKQRCAATVEEALESSGIIGGDGTGCAIVADCEQPRDKVPQMPQKP